MATHDPDCVLALGHKILAPLCGAPAMPVSRTVRPTPLFAGETAYDAPPREWGNRRRAERAAPDYAMNQLKGSTSVDRRRRRSRRGWLRQRRVRAEIRLAFATRCSSQGRSGRLPRRTSEWTPGRFCQTNAMIEALAAPRRGCKRDV